MSAERLSDVEKATIRLTAIQEVQTKQMDKLLENSSVIMVIAESVKDHNEQILDLYSKASTILKVQSENKEELNEKMTEARTAMTKASYGRLFLSLSIASTLCWNLFDINKNKIEGILVTKTSVLQRLLVVEESNKHLHEHINIMEGVK